MKKLDTMDLLQRRNSSVNYKESDSSHGSSSLETSSDEELSNQNSHPARNKNHTTHSSKQQNNSQNHNDSPTDSNAESNASSQTNRHLDHKNAALPSLSNDFIATTLPPIEQPISPILHTEPLPSLVKIPEANPQNKKCKHCENCFRHTQQVLRHEFEVHSDLASFKKQVQMRKDGTLSPILPMPSRVRKRVVKKDEKPENYDEGANKGENSKNGTKNGYEHRSDNDKTKISRENIILELNKRKRAKRQKYNEDEVRFLERENGKSNGKSAGKSTKKSPVRRSVGRPRSSNKKINYGESETSGTPMSDGFNDDLKSNDDLLNELLNSASNDAKLSEATTETSTLSNDVLSDALKAILAASSSNSNSSPFDPTDIISSSKYACSVCQIDFFSKNEYNKHMKTKKHFSRAQNICKTCNVGFEHPLILDHHNFIDKCSLNFRVDRTSTHNCVICSVTFTTTKDMVRHLSRNLHQKRRKKYSGEDDGEYHPPDLNPKSAFNTNFNNCEFSTDFNPKSKLTSRQLTNLVKKADFSNNSNKKTSKMPKTSTRITEDLTEDQSTASTASLLLECLTAINQGNSSVDDLVKNVQQEVEKNTKSEESSSEYSDSEDETSQQGPEKCECGGNPGCAKCIAFNMWSIENFANASNSPNSSPKKKKKKQPRKEESEVITGINGYPIKTEEKPESFRNSKSLLK